ncbi:hypothetical protein GGR50DRAFT_288604 [Xylaria sp. CBS 124048]|nr:hypothetical protein GGR50DRAFT_288604 [Xylaria sp. CBS 124048]
MADENLGDPPLPEAMAVYLDGWLYWYNLLVHRRDDVLPARTHDYTIDFVTDEVRPAPFPLNITETWYCGALLALVLVIHDGLDEGRLLSHAYPDLWWVGRVLGRVLLTVGASVLSTLSFEVAGAYAGRMLQVLKAAIEDRVSRLLIIYLGWGELDENGEPGRRPDGDYGWIWDVARYREIVRDSIQGVSVLAVNYLIFVIIEPGPVIIKPYLERIFKGVLWFLFDVPLDFVPRLVSLLVLPTPNLDDTEDLRGLWFEYGVPVVLQAQVVVFLWLLKILFMAKAERLGLQGYPITDFKMAIIWQLLRATAMHLIAYTSYQAVCAMMIILRYGVPKESSASAAVDGPGFPFLRKVIPEGQIFAGGLLYCFHSFFRFWSVTGVRLARPLWMPYILWQTRYSKHGADTYWPLFVGALEEDLTVIDPVKRVASRAVMTALFGLRSSWPARYQLSSIVDDD